MKLIGKNNYNTQLLVLLSLTFFLALNCFASKDNENKVYKYYSLEVNLFTIEPNNPLDSFALHGNATADENSRAGLSCHDNYRTFMANVFAKNSKGRFIASISLVPGKNDSLTKANSFEVDFTDLKARSYELVKNEDGRLYMLNLTPSIKIVDNRPKRADNTSFQFSIWSFNNSIVIFNDKIYAGRLNCAGGTLAFVSYLGIAKVEFALEPFRNAKLLGTLKDGTIQIRSEDGQTLDIYGDIKNGSDEVQLPGGPYEVWVRWQTLPQEDPKKYETPSKEDWIRLVKAKFAEKGITPPSEEELDIGYEKIKYEKNIALSFGVGPIKDADRINK